MRSYYISNGALQEGPFDLFELKEKKINSTTLVWYEGLENWKAACEIAEVAEILKAGITPPPLPFTSFSQAGGPPPLSIRHHQDSFTSSAQGAIDSAIDESRKSNKKRTLLILVAGFASIILFCILYMNYVHYPKVQAEVLAWEGEMQRLEQEATERKAEERRKYIRNNFSDFIVPELSSYTYYEIGGIENLSVTLHNLAEYRFDKIVVTVEYIKSSGGVYKTEDLVFNRVKAKSETTLKAPKSSRGTRVRCYVSYLYSNRLSMEYDFYTNSVKRNTNNDPFKI